MIEAADAESWRVRLLYFDDLRVGDRFTSGEYEITAQEIIEFAREFDVQEFHLDPEAAKQSLFKGLAASGWQTAAIAMRLFTTTMPFAGGCIGLAVDELRWPIAVRADDRIRCEIEVLKTRVSNSQRGHGIFRMRNTARNQRDEVVLSYIATAMAARRPNE